LNAYSSVTAFTNSNAPLQAAWSASKWTRAAEIVRYTSTSWAAADITKFQNLLTNVHLPLIKSGSSSNGNWELSMLEGVLGIAVFTDDDALFQSGVTMWKQRVPAYFYNIADGSTHKPAPRGTANWYGQTTFNANTNGICQETCRDLGHTQFGMASALNAAATSAIQGTDLFGSESARLVAAMEFNANLLNGASVPSYVCGGSVDRTTLYPTWELGYNHYHNKDGINMPNTLALINNKIRKLSDLSDDHMAVYETLTNSGLP